MLLVLSGYSATGKDTYQNKLLKENPKLKRALSATTRPIRPGEKNEVEYLFVTPENYKVLRNKNMILSERKYNTIENGKNAVWHYGLLKKDFSAHNYITILDHEGARRVRDLLGKDIVKIVYMKAKDKELFKRSKLRQDEEIEFARRLADDKAKFVGIEEIADLIITSEGNGGIHKKNLNKIFTKFL